MKIAVIGTGYVGLVSGVGFSEFGFNVTCVDNNKSKIDRLNKGEVPIYEPSFEVMLSKNFNAGRLAFTTSMSDAVKDADIIFIAVGTPSNQDGSANLSYVYAATEEIADSIKPSAVLVVKSTVPVGTTGKVKKILESKKKVNSVAFNPEFLREGVAIDDFMHPDRIILGVSDDYAKHMLKKVYRPLYTFNTPIVFMNLESAELCKYASNAFLATKVAFINEIADLCEKCNGNINDVALAMGLDHRIGDKFLQAGPGFGGSCFPKDTLALADFASKDFDVKMTIVDAVIKANDSRKSSMTSKILSACDHNVTGKKVTIFGVTFKGDTDDIRDSISLSILPKLQSEGAMITVYDPSNSEAAHDTFNNVEWSQDAYAACIDSDILVILTDWSEFKALDMEKIFRNMKNKTLIDLRNLYMPKDMKKIGFNYFSVGR